MSVEDLSIINSTILQMRLTSVYETRDWGDGIQSWKATSMNQNSLQL